MSYEFVCWHDVGICLSCISVCASLILFHDVFPEDGRDTCDASSWQGSHWCFDMLVHTSLCKMVVANIIQLTTHATQLWTLNPLLVVSTCVISELSGLKTFSCRSNSTWSSIWDIESICVASFSVTQYKGIAPYCVQNKVKVQMWVVSRNTFTTTILENPVSTTVCWLMSTK